MKKTLKRVGIFLFVFLVLVSLYMVFRSDSLKFENEYEIYNYFNEGDFVNVDVPSSNKIKYASKREILDIFKSGTGVIYLGYPSCPWCRNIVPVLLQVIDNSKIDKIYYLDVEGSLYTKSFETELFKYIKDYLRRDSNNKDRLAVPEVFFVKDGKIVGEHLSSVTSQTNPYKELSTAQKEELSSIYQKYVDLLEE